MACALRAPAGLGRGGAPLSERAPLRLPPSLVTRWPESRGDRAAVGALAALLVSGAGLRLWLMVAQRPGFLGYTDSQAYIQAADTVLFGDTLRPAGYPFFLRLVHVADANLSAPILTQHALGLATAVLLYLALRRVDVSRWWALVPVAVVVLAGPQLFLEHAVMSESLFGFLQAAAIYCSIRALPGGAVGWAVAAGLFVGASACVRTLGLLLIPVFGIWVAASPQVWRGRRILLAGAATAAALLPLGLYVIGQNAETGHTGLTRAGGWNLYGRVAPFADCERFDPPSGTSALCERRPENQRPGPAVYIFDAGESPAQRAFDDPFAATSENSARVGSFARAALLGQPFDWLDHVVTEDLPRYVSAERMVRPGQGQGYKDLTITLVDGPNAPNAFGAGANYYSTPGQYRREGALDALRSYESATRIAGPCSWRSCCWRSAAPWPRQGVSAGLHCCWGASRSWACWVPRPRSSTTHATPCRRLGPLRRAPRSAVTWPCEN